MNICNICLKNDILCNACEENVRNGIVNESQIRILKEASKIGASVLNIVENDSMTVIIVEKGHSKTLIGKNGQIVKTLQNSLGKRLKIIENKDEKSMIEDMLMVPIIGMNIIYSDKESHKIRINKNYRNKVHEDRIENLEKILDKKFTISYE